MSVVLDTNTKNVRTQKVATHGAIRIEDVVKIYDPDGAAVMATFCARTFFMFISSMALITCLPTPVPALATASCSHPPSGPAHSLDTQPHRA